MTDRRNNTVVASTPSPRHGEDGCQVRFRAQRIFSIGTDWYFNTRETLEAQGPYTSRTNAESGIKSYISNL